MTGETRQTEAANPRSSELDAMDSLAIVRLMNSEDASVPVAIERILPELAAAIDDIVARLRDGGRLIYVGAGTSGRLAVLDAVECVPTFSVPPTLVSAMLAGGDEAMVHSAEGAEDDVAAARADIDARDVSATDGVVGIAASGTTPYVISALAAARERGALTVGIANNAGTPILEGVDHQLALETGPEVLSGSTRLKAGTSQKLVLNMISTASMVRLGKVHGNRMIDVAITNQKLHARAVGIVMDLVECDRDRAAQLLTDADDEVKTAVLMGLRELDADAARTALAASDGVLRTSLAASAPR